MKTPIETERLVIREFTTSDAAFILHLLNTPGWLQFIENRHMDSLEDAQLYLINGTMKSYVQFGFGFYMVQLKSNDATIGMCGLVKRDMFGNPDLGFAFLPEFVGKGYAYEASKAILAEAKKEPALSQLIAITKHNNERSIGLLKKLNFVFDKTIKFGEEDLQLFKYVDQFPSKN